MNGTRIDRDALRVDFLNARTARGIGIKKAADEIGIAFSNIARLNRGETMSEAILQRLRDWTDAQPAPEPPDPDERWKVIPGYEGFYEASSHGRIRSLARVIEHSGRRKTLISRILRPGPHRSGHLWVDLCGPDGHKTRQVHQLVLETFVGPKPPRMVGCHWDGNPQNNRLDNLRWDTQSANLYDAVKHGTHPGFKNNRGVKA